MELALGRSNSGTHLIERTAMGLTKNAFDLPLEMTQEIASYLSDRDVCALRASCRSVKDAIDDDSFWFKRFHETFDLSSVYVVNAIASNVCEVKQKLKFIYQQRQKRLYKGAPFTAGEIRLKEKKVIRLLAELIKESYNGRTIVDSNELLTCNNIEVLKKFAKNTELLHVFSPGVFQPYNLGLAAIQLMCTPLCLDAELRLHNWNFNLSQKCCYMTAIEAPVFTNRNKTMINVEWLLHVMNFFKYHATAMSENTLFEPFQSLGLLGKPRMWTRPVKSDGYSKLGKHWKGTYAYLDRDQMRMMRKAIEGDDDSKVIIDSNIDHGERAIQTLELDFPGDHPQFKWPMKFETSLGSRSVKYEVPRTRAQHSNRDANPLPKNTDPIFFEGKGYDNEDYCAAGWLNPLPEQHGIPGWMRVTMMKYFDDQHGGWHTNSLWAYEGVVLPGGHIMLGRWWNPDEPHPGAYVGPFIFWDVDGTDNDSNSDSDSDSMDFD